MKGPLKLNFAIVERSGAASYQTIGAAELITNILPLIIVQMLKDQFSDYEDLNVLTPVRFQGTKLLQMLCKFATASENNAKLKLSIETVI